VGVSLREVQRLRAECLTRLGPAHIDEAAREFETAIRSDAKTRVHRNRHFGPVRHVEYNPVSRPNHHGPGMRVTVAQHAFGRPP
jgi:hypothetical protein